MTSHCKWCYYQSIGEKLEKWDLGSERGDKVQLDNIKMLCSQSKIRWSTHCLERMQERDISRADIKKCIANGEIIEDYPDDFPHPSCLVFGYTVNNKVIHVVVGTDEKYIYIITAYFPNMIKFEDDLKTRKGR